MVALRIPPSRAAQALSLLRTIQAHPPSCPCHSHATTSPISDNHHHHSPHSRTHPHPQPRPDRHGRTSRPFLRTLATAPGSGSRSAPGPSPLPDYAFEMAASSIRFGPGCTAEVGMDVANLNARRVLVVTDPRVGKLPVVQDVVLGALGREKQAGNVDAIEVYDRVVVEPKDYSIIDAIEATKRFKPDVIVAVGGGSVIDTAKLMNLYTCNPDAAFLDYVNAPLGKGMPVRGKLLPLIAVPTTAGTGSETTGTAIFDLTTHRAKTGIAHRALKPTLGLCDPVNTATMPPEVKAATGLDVLCHSLESWTAIPYNTRTPRPANPIDRPAYQGANPISDVFSLHALRATVKYLPRAVHNPADGEAGEQMLLAATLAGIGFGNAGVHLCHALSYPISGMNRSYTHPAYEPEAGRTGVTGPLVPHGVAVAVTAPAVFRFTAPSNPDRHLAAAECFGVDTRARNIRKEDVGDVLADAIAHFLDRLGGQPMGISRLGYGVGNTGGARPERAKGEGKVEGTDPTSGAEPTSASDVLDELVEGTLPQRRVLDLAPELQTGADEAALDVQRDQIRRILEQSLQY